jgi:hypothetical protein
VISVLCPHVVTFLIGIQYGASMRRPRRVPRIHCLGGTGWWCSSSGAWALMMVVLAIASLNVPLPDEVRM